MIETDFVQGTIVGGATGVVRAGTSFARAVQTGYLRAYALLLLIGLGGLALYFLIASSMTIHLSIVLFLPLAAGLLGAFLPARPARWVVLAGTVAVLAYAVALLADFDSGAGGLQYVTDDEWIPELGIRYQLGIDGLNLFMVVLTAVAWVPCTLVAASASTTARGSSSSTWRWRETAVLGAFLAQDLALFIVFFDLMLVPFYFLIGGWGSGDRVRATTKFVIYTLAGSLLMLAGAIALGVLATPDGGEISFSLAEIERRARGARARSSGSSCCSRSPSSSRRRCSRCTAGCPRPTAPRRSWCSRCSPACSRRSASTGSCGSCCRPCPTARSTSRS